MSERASESLAEALRAIQVELPDQQTQQLEAYCRLLWEWNTKLNLTRHTDFDRFASRDIVDSLALARPLKTGEEVLDIGSGGGVPGMVLAIVRPDLSISLSESIGKKSQALHAMVESLQLPVAVHACRAEAVLEEFRFDSIVARAVGSLDKMLNWFHPHWSSIGRLLAVKGPRWTAEVADVRQQRYTRQLVIECIERYAMPGLSAESVILEVRRKAG
jgi:16S rRNA (guanine527-N7)-methyltransferase